MSDFNVRHKKIGFSTGALERGNYRQALRWLAVHQIQNVELSALRLAELEPLINDVDSLCMENFAYVSFHAPSAFPEDEESNVVRLLGRVFERGWNIVVHPDVIRKPSLWRPFGKKLLLENMDRRKTVARTADELESYFQELPEALLCLDLAHARQLDTTLILLSEIIDRFHSKIGEIHISELDSNCAHQLMSWTSVADYRQLAVHFRHNLPIIIESMLAGIETSVRLHELESAECAMGYREARIQHARNVFYFSFEKPSTFSWPFAKQIIKNLQANGRKQKAFSLARKKNENRKKKVSRRYRSKHLA